MATTPTVNQQTHTWEDDIKGLFNDGDIACMKQRGLDLSNYQDVKASAPPAGSRYDDIWFVSPGMGWAVNSDGQILYTEDGGASWTQQFRTPMIGTRAVYLRCISFASPQRGWVGTLTDDYRMFQTANGGTTWTFVSNLPDNASRAICGLYAVNESVVYASGTNFPYQRYPTRVMKTTDGGETWTRYPINDPQGNANLEGIGFITEDRGWVSGWGDANFTGGYTSGTTDGGETWSDANQVGRFINRFCFLGNPLTVGYASGRQVYKYNPEGDPEAPSTSLAAAGLAPEGTMLRTGGLQRFTNTAEIGIEVPQGARHAWVNIWNRFGLEVRLLLDESDPSAGTRLLTWDGLDDDGNPVPAGVYIFRLTVDNNADSGSFYLERSPV